MLSKIVELMFIFSLLFGAVNGTIDELSAKCASAAGDAVTTLISMSGGICLWSGLMEIMSESGMAEGLRRLLKLPVRLLYGRLDGDEEAVSYISQNMAANILGLGSAATPAGLSAADRLRNLHERGRIGTGPLITLMAVNTVSIQLIPVSVASARAALGAAAPYDILPAVWCASICSFLAAVIFAKSGVRD